MRWSHICNDGNPAMVRVGYDCARCGVKWPVALTPGFETPNLRLLKAQAELEKPHARILARAGDVLELCRRAGL